MKNYMKGDDWNMKKLRSLTGKFTEKLGVEPEVAENIPKVTMLGANELQIENHKGIIEYSNENIRINTEYGVVHVEGIKLNCSAFCLVYLIAQHDEKFLFYSMKF